MSERGEREGEREREGKREKDDHRLMRVTTGTYSSIFSCLFSVKTLHKRLKVTQKMDSTTIQSVSSSQKP